MNVALTGILLTVFIILVHVSMLICANQHYTQRTGVLGDRLVCLCLNGPVFFHLLRFQCVCVCVTVVTAAERRQTVSNAGQQLPRTQQLSTRCGSMIYFLTTSIGETEIAGLSLLLTALCVWTGELQSHSWWKTNRSLLCRWAYSNQSNRSESQRRQNASHVKWKHLREIVWKIQTEFPQLCGDRRNSYRGTQREAEMLR